MHVNETSRDLWYIQTVTDVGPAGEGGTISLVVSINIMFIISTAARGIYPGRSDYLVFSH